MACRNSSRPIESVELEEDVTHRISADFMGRLELQQTGFQLVGLKAEWGFGPTMVGCPLSLDVLDWTGDMLSLLLLLKMTTMVMMMTVLYACSLSVVNYIPLNNKKNRKCQLHVPSGHV